MAKKPPNLKSKRTRQKNPLKLQKHSWFSPALEQPLQRSEITERIINPAALKPGQRRGGFLAGIEVGGGRKFGEKNLGEKKIASC